MKLIFHSFGEFGFVGFCLYTFSRKNMDRDVQISKCDVEESNLWAIWILLLFILLVYTTLFCGINFYSISEFCPFIQKIQVRRMKMSPIYPRHQAGNYNDYEFDPQTDFAQVFPLILTNLNPESTSFPLFSHNDQNQLNYHSQIIQFSNLCSFCSLFCSKSVWSIRDIFSRQYVFLSNLDRINQDPII